MQHKELIQLKREARLKGGFYVNPEAKMLFIIRIRGYASLFAIYIFVNFHCNSMLMLKHHIRYYFLTFMFLNIQYQRHGPQVKENLAALAFETGEFLITHSRVLILLLCFLITYCFLMTGHVTSLCVVLDALMQLC